MPSTSPAKATVLLDTNRVISPISPLLFSGFAEHLGRCIYEGMYDPASPHSDKRGFRLDVIAALRELNFRTIRYPGGNFLSGYYWQDGVGPREKRPRRRDLAWQSTETNQFGTDEFVEYCREIQAEPMLGVNMGTASIQDAANLVEYCNASAGTEYADLRIANGHREPHSVKYWCLGNEMDGPWQIGHLEATEYGSKAREAAKMMRWHDPSIKLILCGSSSINMATFPEWDRVALELCWEQVDYHSMHYYANNHDDDTDSFLALSTEFESYVDTLGGVLRYVKAKRRSKRDVFLSWDEWNVWYRARSGKAVAASWAEAPHLLEEVYNLEDALVVAEWMNVFLRKSDVLKIACLAQIVNVIAPLLTTRDAVLKQSIFYPFALFSKLAVGAALDVVVKSPVHKTARFGEVPLLDVGASYDAAGSASAIFIVNRSQTESLAVDLRWQDLAPRSLAGVYQVAGTDPKAANSFDKPDNVIARQVAVPAVDGKVATLVVPPLSFTAIDARI